MIRFLLFCLLFTPFSFNTGNRSPQASSVKTFAEDEPNYLPASGIDTTDVVKAFEAVKGSPAFLKKMELSRNEPYAIYDEERPVLIGDLNRDQQPDALMPFTIEGRGGGNHYEIYYAIFINEGGKLKFKNTFARGAKASEHWTTLSEIRNDTLIGWQIPGFHYPENDSIPAVYHYRQGELAEIPWD